MINIYHDSSVEYLKNEREGLSWSCHDHDFDFTDNEAWSDGLNIEYAINNKISSINLPSVKLVAWSVMFN